MVKNNYTSKLNIKQKKFCELYVGKHLGNGTLAYQEAYETENYNSAKTNAHKLLTNTYISGYINTLLEKNKLNNEAVDIQLAFLIAQHGNLNAKMRAISEYNKLKRRYGELNLNNIEPLGVIILPQEEHNSF